DLGSIGDRRGTAVGARGEDEDGLVIGSKAAQGGRESSGIGDVDHLVFGEAGALVGAVEVAGGAWAVVVLGAGEAGGVRAADGGGAGAGVGLVGSALDAQALGAADGECGVGLFAGGVRVVEGIARHARPLGGTKRRVALAIAVFGTCRPRGGRVEA